MRELSNCGGAVDIMWVFLGVRLVRDERIATAWHLRHKYYVLFNLSQPNACVYSIQSNFV
jgi:hypothetical protein